MANTILKPEQISAMSLGLLEKQLVLARLFRRMGLADFAGKKDDTVNMKLPPLLNAKTRALRDRATPFDVDEFTEVSIPVSLDTFISQGIGMTDENLTLDINNFGEQILMPQVKAVAEEADYLIADALAAAPVDAANVVAWDLTTDAPLAKVTEARKILNKADVDQGGRFLLIGPDVEEKILNLPELTDADRSGSTGALRNGVIGNLRGFDIVVTNLIGDMGAYACHPTALACAFGAPVVPAGAVRGSSQNYNNLAMRWIQDYDALQRSDRSFVDMFSGVSSVNDKRVKTRGAANKGALDGNVNVRFVKFTVTAT